MRPRTEIEEEAENYNRINNKFLLEVLLDIRDLLEEGKVEITGEPITNPPLTN